MTLRDELRVDESVEFCIFSSWFKCVGVYRSLPAHIFPCLACQPNILQRFSTGNFPLNFIRKLAAFSRSHYARETGNVQNFFLRRPHKPESTSVWDLYKKENFQQTPATFFLIHDEMYVNVNFTSWKFYY